MAKAWIAALALPAAGAAQAEDSCGMAAAEPYVGHRLGEAQGHLGAGPVRVIHPGDMVTQDYDPARLNVEVDADGVITRLRCG